MALVDKLCLKDREATEELGQSQGHPGLPVGLHGLTTYEQKHWCREVWQALVWRC